MGPVLRATIFLDSIGVGDGGGARGHVPPKFGENIFGTIIT